MSHHPFLVFLDRKLGRCTRCMRLSASLTLGGWAAYLLVVLLGPQGQPFGVLRAALLVVALALTAMTIAHLVAFAARFRNAVRATMDKLAGGLPSINSTTSSSSPPLALQRRSFLIALGQATAFALLGPIILRARPAWAQTTQPTCPGTHAINPSNVITLDTCVNRKNKDQAKQAQNQTQGKAKQDAMNFAEESCKTMTCSENQDCARDGVGYTLVFVECTANLSRVCEDKKNQELFTCTWRVTAIKCKCQRN